MTRSGASVEVIVTVSPILGLDGAVIGISSIARDITSRRLAEAEADHLNDELERRVKQRTSELEERTAELEHSMDELDSFAYSVSHDLRAPLRAMDGFSRIALDELGPELGPEKRHYLEYIRESAQGMQQLVDGLLDFSRLGRRSLKAVDVAPAVLVRQALSDLGPAAERADVDITIGDLPNCTADPTLLKQVFVNLISNALKFTTNVTDARIHVGADVEGPDTTYFVRDTGVGFDPRYADKIFGVFQRLHLAEDYPGTGIGLALVQRVIEKHGGRIWCEGAVDKGATFFFTLATKAKTSD
jgi:light-regulated signal transduction histidine kinase (bacteriophytochrome)